MRIEFIAPLSRAWERMKGALFRPAELSKWLAIGFTAFLAGLTRCGGTYGSSWSRGDRVDPDQIWNAPDRAWEWLAAHPVRVAVVLGVLIVLAVLFVVVHWLSARGSFMFLDNVVHDRALVERPWREYRAEGNSLFLWMIAFSFAFLFLVVAYAIGSFVFLRALYQDHGTTAALVVPGLALLGGFAGIVVLASLVQLFLGDFVVPIMYRFRLTASGGWGVFLPLLAARPFAFIGYALLVVALHFAAGVIVLLAGCLTCCIGFLFLVLPYVGTVVLLPFLYTLRAYGVEFLGQFGADYRLFPPEDGPPPTEVAPAPVEG